MNALMSHHTSQTAQVVVIERFLFVVKILFVRSYMVFTSTLVEKSSETRQSYNTYCHFLRGVIHQQVKMASISIFSSIFWLCLLPPTRGGPGQDQR